MTGDYRPAPGREEACDTAKPPGEPRIYGPFPAVVKGVDALGERFKVSAVLDTLTASELRLSLSRVVAVGERLFVAARIHKATVLLRGTVSQAEPVADGVCGLAVAISRNRFLDPAVGGSFAAAPEVETGPAEPA